MATKRLHPSDKASRLKFLENEFHEDNPVSFAESLSSKLSFLWRGTCGHVFSMRAGNRLNLLHNCPFCSNQRVLKGFNDLKSCFPEVALEWDHSANSNSPSEVVFGSAKKVFWRCRSFDHQWITSISKRTASGTRCPVCANRNILAGFNDITTSHPIQVKNWDYAKNPDLDPTSLGRTSKKVVNWKCGKCKREWAGRVDKRCDRINSCRCEAKTGTSSYEAEIRLLLQDMGVAFISNTYSIIKPFELDFYFPDLNLAIEFNGNFWHDKDKWHEDIKNNTRLSRELIKSKLAESRGISLIHIWEDDWLRMDPNDRLPYMQNLLVGD